MAQRGHGTVFCGNWYADFPDPDNFFYVFFHSDSAQIPGFYFHSAELDAQKATHRSPLVAQCVRDFLAGRRFPLDLFSPEFA